jgi:hypothetical protein
MAALDQSVGNVVEDLAVNAHQGTFHSKASSPAIGSEWTSFMFALVLVSIHLPISSTLLD